MTDFTTLCYTGMLLISHIMLFYLGIVIGKELQKVEELPADKGKSEVKNNG